MMALYSGWTCASASADDGAGNPIISWAAMRRRHADLVRRRCEQVGEREGDDLGGAVEVLQHQALVGPVAVGLQERARPGPVKHCWDASRRIEPCVGIDGYTVRLHGR